MATVTEQVIDRVRVRILDGIYAPGQHLHEVSLAEDLKVSRTPIRDALRVLAHEELLVYSPNRGYVVRQVELNDVLNAYDTRGALEGLACRIVAERGLSAKSQAEFERIIAEGDQIFSSRSWGEAEQAAWRNLNLDFHLAIVEASQNYHLPALLRQVRRIPRMFDSRLEPETEFYQQVHTRVERLRAHGEHIEIVGAISQREGTRAEALMREHIYRNREVLRRAFEDNRTVDTLGNKMIRKSAAAKGKKRSPASSKPGLNDTSPADDASVIHP